MNKRVQITLLLLTGASGATDALAFTALGSVFAGVMTGNLVLLGISAGRGDGAEVTGPLVALGGYVAGAACAALACRGSRRRAAGQLWPGAVVACLAAQCVLLAAVAVAAGVLGGRPGEGWRITLLACGAVAMGGQSAAMVAAGAGGAPTTYFTGTLTTLVTGAVDGTGRGIGQLWTAARLVAVVGGAACAVAVHTAAPPWGFVPPVVLTACAVACQKPAHRLRRAVTQGAGYSMHGAHDETH
ncbi:YoaK family protein [Streptomyces sp. NPDC059639]|uniref:YoaK family protein n=1 Tax=Streptomyces sp. NPDC059639 TaxID=3346891 RepID=UPI0036A0AD86